MPGDRTEHVISGSNGSGGHSRQGANNVSAVQEDSVEPVDRKDESEYAGRNDQAELGMDDLMLDSVIIPALDTVSS